MVDTRAAACGPPTAGATAYSHVDSIPPASSSCCAQGGSISVVRRAFLICVCFAAVFISAIVIVPSVPSGHFEHLNRS